MLDTITRKLYAPASNGLPDGPQNQIESTPAIEADIIEAMAKKAQKSKAHEHLDEVTL